MPTDTKKEKNENSEPQHTSSVRSVERFLDVVTDTTSTTLKAGGRVSDDVTSMTKNMLLNALRTAGDMAAVLGTVALENARGGVKGAGELGNEAGGVVRESAKGTIRGVSEVGSEAGNALKRAALGLIHGTAEVGAELGKVCKVNAIAGIQGAGEVSSELGKVAKAQSQGFIEGGTETALQFEDGLLQVARKMYGGILEIQEEYSTRPSGEKDSGTPKDEPTS